MSKSRKVEFMKGKTFLGRLQATIQSLPTDAEKRQAQEKIAALVEFLNSLQMAVKSMPTTDSVTQTKEALDWLQDLLSKAEANPVLAGLAPAPRVPRPRKGKQGVTEQDIASAKIDLEALQSMGVEEIRAKLLDEDGYALSRVRAIAATLGVGGTEKLSRESLAHQITTKIANYRGYERLTGKRAGE